MQQQERTSTENDTHFTTTVELVGLQFTRKTVETYIANTRAVERGGALLNSISHTRAALEGHVLKLEAKCKGTAQYDIVVRLNVETQDVVDATCTCPVPTKGKCKHCAAVMLLFCARYEDFLPKSIESSNIGHPERGTGSSIPRTPQKPAVLKTPLSTPAKRKLPWNTNDGQKRVKKTIPASSTSTQSNAASPKQAGTHPAQAKSTPVSKEQTPKHPSVLYIQTDDEVLEAARKYLLPFRQQRLRELEEEEKRRVIEEPTGSKSMRPMKSTGRLKTSKRNIKGKPKVPDPNFWNIIDPHEDDSVRGDTNQNLPVPNRRTVEHARPSSPRKQDSFLNDDTKYLPRTGSSEQSTTVHTKRAILLDSDTDDDTDAPNNNVAPPNEGTNPVLHAPATLKQGETEVHERPLQGLLGESDTDDDGDDKLGSNPSTLDSSPIASMPAHESTSIGTSRRHEGKSWGDAKLTDRINATTGGSKPATNRIDAMLEDLFF
ncbi:uncharacterized protein SPPG_06241 [Spizellomyces punctatus DAOM BR117]|uniref:SWIM-type domain-containing protein n=1 Tax=Spizellomyces punctatus (strain DAOM BR117) TaxID=645134 RepID=A0A0L0HBH2_SPIPD|nr:uncharacterized protein SPPG_06241 [Spizellomyces punctatus DAOM BR117]KNC98552.1 hypothetical protein SPPG_06241 [Spizellomyces punctatus DAOM BR117]|eukprot:XP_016606592.1 hypothetical protein SPPG_06241 [Spizellomyces punctatus DAOM BR117]